MHEMLRNLTEKLRAKLPAAMHVYSMVDLPISTILLSIFFGTGSKPSRRSNNAAKR